MSSTRERQTLDAPIRIAVDSAESPHAWIEDLLHIARKRKQTSVAVALVGALLTRKGCIVGDSGPGATRSEEHGGFITGDVVTYVALAPASDVIDKCAQALRQGRHPLLLLPRRMIERGKGAASAIPDLERRMSFAGIEDFLVLGVLQLAHEEGVSHLAEWESIVRHYNERVTPLNGRLPQITMAIVGENDGNSE